MLYDMTTQSLTSALHEDMSCHGCCKTRISLDPGSSLVPAMMKMAEELGDLVAEDA